MFIFVNKISCKMFVIEKRKCLVFFDYVWKNSYESSFWKINCFYVNVFLNDVMNMYGNICFLFSFCGNSYVICCFVCYFVLDNCFIGFF